jgi:hypothetical protein
MREWEGLDPFAGPRLLWLSNPLFEKMDKGPPLLNEGDTPLDSGFLSYFHACNTNSGKAQTRSGGGHLEIRPGGEFLC